MIKAIPTEYNGIKYKSRTEARWAIFFDISDIPARYEAEGYQTESGWYLPDFLISSNASVFFEVKPGLATEEEIVKCAALAHGVDGSAVFIAMGLPDPGVGIWRIFEETYRVGERYYFTRDVLGQVSYLSDSPRKGSTHIQIRKDAADVNPRTINDVFHEMETAGRHQFDSFDRRNGWRQ
jgi:hypothetical protein